MPRKDLIKIRSGTTAQWAAADAASPPRLLALGEPGVNSDTGEHKTGDGVKTWAQLPVDGSGTYERPRVLGPTPTGVAATDTANLIQAVGDTPEGGRLWLPSSNTFFALQTGPLVVNKNISIEGDSIGAQFDLGEGSPSIPTNGLVGTVIKQVTLGQDVLSVTKHNTSLNLRKIGLTFDQALASTGHGISARPSLVQGAGHYPGLVDFHWERVYVWGHDGNHYGFNLLNTLYGLLEFCRSYGGGGFWIEADAGTINSGNLVLNMPYVSVNRAGTAHGIAHSAATSTHPGELNFITYIRPQVNISEAAYTQGTQKNYTDLMGASVPLHIHVMDPDWEGITSATQVEVGYGTQIDGDPFMNNFVNRFITGTARGFRAAGKTNADKGQFAAFGYQALAENTSGQRNTAFGFYALSESATSDFNTGLGNQAGKFHLGAQNTFVGADAGLGVTGTSTGGLHTAVGYSALKANTTGTGNTAIGFSALSANTTGLANVAVGRDAGAAPNGTSANSTKVGNNNTFVGYQSGASDSSDPSAAVTLGYKALALSNATALGAGTSAGATGAVAIGRDSAGGGATTTTSNEIALGTANHKVKISNNSTGAGSAALGANCPAVTPTAPYTWFRMTAGDASAVYVPAWK